MVAVQGVPDWNCPQHITPRFTAEEIDELVAPLHARIAELGAHTGTEEGFFQTTAIPVRNEVDELQMERLAVASKKSTPRRSPI